MKKDVASSKSSLRSTCGLNWQGHLALGVWRAGPKDTNRSKMIKAKFSIVPGIYALRLLHAFVFFSKNITSRTKAMGVKQAPLDDPGIKLRYLSTDGQFLGVTIHIFLDLGLDGSNDMKIYELPKHPKLPH